MSKIIYVKSLTAKLVLNRSFTLDCFGKINDFINAHKDVVVKNSFNHMTVFYDKKQTAMVRVARKNVVIYLALEPSTLIDKYDITDVSEVLSYKKYPSKFVIKTEEDLTKAIELLELAFDDKGCNKLCKGSKVDYDKIYYERDLTTLVNEGLVKKYVREDLNTIEEDMEDEIEETPSNNYNVTFKASLVYDAQNTAKDLYIITNYDDWNLNKATKMTKVNDNYFVCDKEFKEGYPLEFKIVSDLTWDNVEKGIFREEIVNHHYTVNKNLEVEDLIHSFKNM